MKKIFITLTLCMVSIIGFISCTKSKDIGELISLRNKYQSEYDLYHATWDLRYFERFGYIDENTNTRLMATFEEHQRELLCKDSIEILNIEIDKYKNH